MSLRLSVNLGSYFKSKDPDKIYYILINSKSNFMAPTVRELTTKQWLELHHFLEALVPDEK